MGIASVPARHGTGVISAAGITIESTIVALLNSVFSMPMANVWRYFLLFASGSKVSSELSVYTATSRAGALRQIDAQHADDRNVQRLVLAGC